MSIRYLISPIALAAALSFSTGAMAQTTVMRGVEIPPDDLPEVQSLCNSLLAQANESLTANGDDEGDDAEGDDTDGADGDTGDDADGDNGDDADGDDGDNGDDTDTQDPASEDESEPSGLAQAVTTIDLDTITLEDCKAAGLVDTEKVVVE